MKVKVNKQAELSKVELSVVFTKEEFDAEFEKQLEKELAQAELKGFRKGKVPRKMYLSHFGDQRVKYNTIDELINTSYPEVVQSKKLDVVSMPEIDVLDNLKEGEWGYKATVYVYPEVDVKDYYGIECQKEEAVVTKEDLENEVERLLAQHGDLEVTEDAIEKGYTAVFDFLGSVDGVEFEGGKAENYSLEIGSGQFIPGFEDQMLGMKAGEEKVVKVTFPEEYHAKDLAGKPADFKVTVHEVKKLVKPELNDEFVSGLEIQEVKTVEEWKEYLKNNLQKEKEEAANNKFVDEVFKKLLEANPVVIPDVMVEERVEGRVKQLEETAKAYGIPLDMFLQYQGVKDVAQYKELLTPGIKEQLHYEVVVGAVAKKEKVKVSQKEFESLAKGQDVEQLKAQYPLDVLEKHFKLVKTHNLILENVKA